MLRQRQRVVALAAALAFTLTACGESTDDSAASPTQTQPTSAPPDDEATSTTPTDDESSISPTEEDSMKPSPIPVPEPGQSALPTGPVPDAVVQRSDVVAAIEEHAKRENVTVEDVTVEGFAEVTWSDGSLGCPQPGQMYTQALVPGAQLVLAVDGRLASYHAAEGEDFSYCANPIPPAETRATS